MTVKGEPESAVQTGAHRPRYGPGRNFLRFVWPTEAVPGLATFAAGFLTIS